MGPQPLSEVGVGGLVYMLVLGVALSLWPLAIVTNFHGYRDSYMRRVIRSAQRKKFPFRLQPGTFGSEFDLKFAKVMRWIVACGFLLGSAALIMTAIVQLVDRAMRP
jgi:hypothetical protein